MESAESHGYSDGQTWAREATREELEQFVQDGGDWADALLTAIGRAELLENLCGVEDTDENWQDVGLPWCREYAKAADRGARAVALERLG